MRLLECSGGKPRLTEDLVTNIPRYAILSHTWGRDADEVTLKDLEADVGERKAGYQKIRFCAEQAKRDGLHYIWIDTCCIDKSNNTELSEAINSMFRWYFNAERCYVYLSDIVTTSYEHNGQRLTLACESAFRTSRWFTRGWTLQELLAPETVEFFSQDGQRLGDKKTLEQPIHDVTGIPVSALRSRTLSQFGIEERFAWAERRQTTREEDWAYCLLGIFGVYIPLIYGEGRENAVRRLKQDIGHPVASTEAMNRTWTVPFERNTAFTSREADLKKLSESLAATHRTAKVAITGLGGVGKTQLALEYLYRRSAEQKDLSVIWIPAISTEGIRQAYLQAAKQLGIAGHESDNNDVIRLVQDHLSGDSVGAWLLVFDNADDISLWTDKPTHESSRLIDGLPQNSHGSIIFTTRDRKAAVTLAGQSVITLSELDDAGGDQLLRNCLIDQDLVKDQSDITALLDQLTYLPLAIIQAAEYINKNEIGLTDYISLLEDQEEDVIDLLSEDFEDRGRYRAVKNPVATTWLISFEQIRQRDQLATEFLSFLACVDAKEIPQSLLPQSHSRKKVIDAIGTLKGYSFITVRPADSTINIHRLVHLATRNWLRKEGFLTNWSYKVVARLSELLVDPGQSDRAIWRSYLPHASYALGSGFIRDDMPVQSLLRRYGRCLYADGRYREAESPLMRVLEICKTKLGVNHPDTVESINDLALVYKYQGQWKKAEKLFLQAITTTELGPDHPIILSSIFSLASTYRYEGRLDEAEQLCVQVIEKHKTRLGADHDDTLAAMANLAITFWRQRRWDEAEKLHRQVMEIRKIKLGADHPATLISINNLGSTLLEQDRLEEAETLLAQVLRTRRIKLGNDHPDTLITMGNLASTLSKQGRLQEAETLLTQVLETRRVKLGVDHPSTLISMGNLASTLSKQGRLEEAATLQTQVLEICKVKLGDDHPDTISSMSFLQWMFYRQGRLEEAEKLGEQVVEISTSKFGADHQLTFRGIRNLAFTRRALGRHADALAMMEECVEAQRQVLGPKHPSTLSSEASLEEWRQTLRTGGQPS